MACLLLPFIAALVACNPPPKEAAMRNPSPPENAASAPQGDSPTQAEGRRILSTAFVRVGPDGHLTVELRDGRAMVLRDVVMRPADFCGVQVLGGSAGRRYCGGYGENAGGPPRRAPAPRAPPPPRPHPPPPG